MEAKYYTPQISDIFIGFECELFYQDDFKLARTENLKWHKTIIDKNKFQQAFSLIKVNKIRVKHLDIQDIKSCGWNKETILLQDDEGEDMYSSGFSISFEENTWFELVIMENDKIYIQKKWYRNSVTQLCRSLFYGEIKNISELKKLMIQLNIK